jgi:Ca2+-binding EF-hand superfamily protein
VFNWVVEKRKPRKNSVESAWLILMRARERDPDVFSRCISRIFRTHDAYWAGWIEVSELVGSLLGFGMHLSLDQVTALKYDLDKANSNRISLAQFNGYVRDMQLKAERSSKPIDRRTLDAAWFMILSMAKGSDWNLVIESLFRELDHDGIGEVDLTNLTESLDSICKSRGRARMTPEQLQMLYDDLDADYSGSISLREFVVAAEYYRPSKGPEVEAWRLLLKLVDETPANWAKSVEALFHDLDANQSGNLDLAELGAKLSSLGLELTEAQLDGFLKGVDKEFAGFISKRDFVAAVERRKPSASSSEASWIVLLGMLDDDPSASIRSIPRMFKTFDNDGSGSIDIRSWSLYYYTIINVDFMNMLYI